MGIAIFFTFVVELIPIIRLMSWQTLPNGILLKNAPTLNTLNDTYNADIEELGYNRNELYVGDYFSIRPTIIGYFKLITRELIAIHRDDDLIMSQADIDNYLSELFGLREYEEEDLIKEGIENRGISQKYIESVCGGKAYDNTIINGKYVFEFEDGFLSNFHHGDGLSATARDVLDVDAYIQAAYSWYGGDKTKIVREINLHAACFGTIDLTYIRSSTIRRQFSYPNGCCNYIAMAAFYKSYDVSFDDLLNSTHGLYEIIEKDTLSTKIKAYGKIYTQVTDLCDINANTTHEEGSDGRSGYVYVMINPSLPNLVKIGKTTREPSERAKELSSATGVPTPFILVYSKPFADCHFAEKVIHGYLEDKGARVNGNREFFKISTSEAIDLINVYYNIEQNEMSK